MRTRPNDYSISSVFGAVSEDLRDEVAAFWVNNGALPNVDAARQRADQLVCVARNAAGEIVGVNTAYVSGLGAEQRRYFFCRMFIRPSDRLLQLASALARAGVDALREHRHAEAAIRGVALLAENPKFMRAGGRRFLTKLGWCQVGQDARGQDVWTIEFDPA